MVNKKVPDWLNSSLWSSSQPSPSPPTPQNHAAPIVEAPLVVPPQEPHNSSTTVTADVKGEIRDPLSSGYGNSTSVRYSDDENGSSSANSTASAGGVNVDAAPPAEPPATPPAPEDISRQAQLLQELSRKVINMGEIQRIASQGMPDGAGIRATVWKLLLGYLPSDRSLWPSELSKKRSQYKHFKEELLVNPVNS